MKLFTARRASAVVASAAAITLGVAGTASAHHCYKVDWNEAAHANQSQNGSPWTPLSDVFEMFVVGEVYGGLESCVGTGDQAAAMFMEATDMTMEPLIHARATIGTGEKAHPQGKHNPVVNYLFIDHVELLDSIVYTIGVECGAFPAP